MIHFRHSELTPRPHRPLVAPMFPNSCIRHALFPVTLRLSLSSSRFVFLYSELFEFLVRFRYLSSLELF